MCIRDSVCTALKIATRDNPNFISNVITGDESWAYGYDPDTKPVSYTHLDVYKRQLRVIALLSYPIMRT